MRPIELRKVKQEEIFRLANNETAPLWVRGYYEHSEKSMSVTSTIIATTRLS